VIVYLDTSSLVKLYVDEPASLDVVALVDDAAVVTTAAVAYAEARAALARRYREGVLSRRALATSIRHLDADWPALLVLDVDDALCRHAGELAQRHALRGYDAVHLSAFASVARAAGPSNCRFSSADRALSRAAAALLRTL
jgi:predicted nucleic acid-binding protein